MIKLDAIDLIRNTSYYQLNDIFWIEVKPFKIQGSKYYSNECENERELLT